MCRLSAAQLAKLRAALEIAAAAWGWSEDQRWTLDRVTALIGRLFHVRYTPRGTSYLLHRLGRAAKASAAACPKRTTPPWSPPRTSNCMPRSSCAGTIVKNRLKRIQYQPKLIGGFLGQTGLTLEPKPP